MQPRGLGALVESVEQRAVYSSGLAFEPWEVPNKGATPDQSAPKGYGRPEALSKKNLLIKKKSGMLLYLKLRDSMRKEEHNSTCHLMLPIRYCPTKVPTGYQSTTPRHETYRRISDYDFVYSYTQSSWPSHLFLFGLFLLLKPFVYPLLIFYH